MQTSLGWPQALRLIAAAFLLCGCARPLQREARFVPCPIPVVLQGRAYQVSLARQERTAQILVLEVEADARSSGGSMEPLEVHYLDGPSVPVPMHPAAGLPVFGNWTRRDYTSEGDVPLQRQGRPLSRLTLRARGQRAEVFPDWSVAEGVSLAGMLGSSVRGMGALFRGERLRGWAWLCPDGHDWTGAQVTLALGKGRDRHPVPASAKVVLGHDLVLITWVCPAGDTEVPLRSSVVTIRSGDGQGVWIGGLGIDD